MLAAWRIASQLALALADVFQFGRGGAEQFYIMSVEFSPFARFEIA